MTGSGDRAFIAELGAAMAEDVGRPPDAVLARVLERTAQDRPLRRVAALIVEPPMILPQRMVVGLPRRRLLLVAAALIIGSSLLLSGIAGGWLARHLPTRPPDALEVIRAQGVIRVAVTAERSSTGASRTDPAGFESDVATELAARLGVVTNVTSLDTVDPVAASKPWDA